MLRMRFIVVVAAVALLTLVLFWFLQNPSLPAGINSHQRDAARQLQRLGCELYVDDGGYINQVDLFLDRQRARRPLSKDDLSALRQLPKLLALRLDTSLDDESFSIVADLPQLQLLWMPLGITDEGASAIAGLVNLRVLKMSHSLGAKSLGYLQKLQALESLDLSDANIVGPELDSLANLSRLSNLDISGISGDLNNLNQIVTIKALKLNHAAISSDTLSQIRPTLERLNSLCMKNCQLQDSQLELLSGLPKLESLDLSMNEISDQGVTQLQALPQGCEWHEDYSACITCPSAVFKSKDPRDRCGTRLSRDTL